MAGDAVAGLGREGRFFRERLGQMLLRTEKSGSGTKKSALTGAAVPPIFFRGSIAKLPVFSKIATKSGKKRGSKIKK